MASNKNAQNSAPRDLKRTNCTSFCIFTCQKIACKLTYVEACSDRGKSGIHSVIIGNQNKII